MKCDNLHADQQLRQARKNKLNSYLDDTIRNNAKLLSYCQRQTSIIITFCTHWTLLIHSVRPKHAKGGLLRIMVSTDNRETRSSLSALSLSVFMSAFGFCFLHRSNLGQVICANKRKRNILKRRRRNEETPELRSHANHKTRKKTSKCWQAKGKHTHTQKDTWKKKQNLSKKWITKGKLQQVEFHCPAKENEQQ